MESFVYKDIIKQEKDHWWFKARREIIDTILKDLNLKEPKILEIGCGTGGNLKMLKKYGDTSAIEMDEFAVNYANKEFKNVQQGYLPNNIPFDEKFDLICMFDVLEHIEEDKLSIEVLKKHLNPNGILLITVPAYQWLYGSHDKFLHHKRRYSLNQIESILKDFSILKKSYFNTFLFPLVVLSRIIDKLIPHKDNSLGYNIPNKIINSFFYKIFKLEKNLLTKYSFPFGSSILIAVKI